MILHKNISKKIKLLTLNALLTFTIHLPLLSNTTAKNYPIESFIENKGQIIDQNQNLNPNCLFLLNLPNFKVQLRNTGFSYEIWKRESSPKETASRNTIPKNLSSVEEKTTWKIHRIDFEFENPLPRIITEVDERSQEYLNYYTSSTSERGAINVHHYEKVTYKEVWKGIDIEFFTDNKTRKNVKYNIVVKPGANVNDIQFKINGTDELSVVNGKIRIETTLGAIEETVPYSYETDNDQRVMCGFKELRKGLYGLEVMGYTGRGTLVIDPTPSLTWGTYYGGTGDDIGRSCIVDGTDVYIAGSTTSTTTIATAGTHQTSIGGSMDAFLAKFNSAGTRLWATYYGGTGNDWANSCKIDGSGNIYIAGETYSSASISTGGSHQAAFGGASGAGDLFLAKFNSSGTRQWATYYGGSGFETTASCAVDASGNVYISGATTSTTAIATGGAHQTANGGGFSGYDGFLVKFNSSGARQWGTYYGGTTDDYSTGVTTDASSNVYLCGFTLSSTSIATAGSHQPAWAGDNDGYLVKFNSSGARQWATYYGGTGNDVAYSCATDNSGNVYLAGMAVTATAGVIATAGAHQTSHNGGCFPGNDGYLVKFNSAGARQWGTYYGGTGEEYIVSCVTDGSGNVYLTGSTASTTFIATAGSHQPSYGGGFIDGFLVKFDGSGVRQWGSYYGGTDYDELMNCAITGSSELYVAGQTTSTTAIATAGSHQVSFGGGGSDAFLAKFSGCIIPSAPTTITGSTTMCAGGTTSYTVTAVAGATGYTWSNPTGWTINSGQGTATENVTTSTTSGNVCVTADNGCGSSAAYCIAVTIPSNGGAGLWTWTGTVNTNWFNPCNWDKQSLPNTVSNVLIPNTTNKALITAGTGECYTIEIQTTTGAYVTVDISGGGALSVTQP